MSQPKGYWDGPYWVFTEAHHLERGSCCGNGCRHCPYEPRAVKGNTCPRAEFRAPLPDGTRS